METKSEQVQSMARHLKLASVAGGLENLLTQAKDGQTSYLDFAFNLLNTEVTYRNHQNFLKRQKSSKLPLVHDLSNWKDNPDCGVSLHQVAQLQECLWLEQNFNLMLMGPSGTGYVKFYIIVGKLLSPFRSHGNSITPGGHYNGTENAGPGYSSWLTGIYWPIRPLMLSLLSPKMLWFGSVRKKSVAGAKFLPMVAFSSRSSRPL